MAFYNTDLALGFIPHRHDRDLTSAKTSKRRLAVEYSSHWLETAAVATLTVVEITDCVHSQEDSFQRVPSGIVLNALSVMTVRQCGDKLHRTVSPSWINVLCCIPCT